MMASVANASSTDVSDRARSTAPRDYHASCYAAFLRDPDGNRIEAVCHHAV
jgi:hypothetical protein